VGRIIIIVDLFRIIMAASISKVNCSLSWFQMVHKLANLKVVELSLLFYKNIE
jgi:hypothetical protein